MFHTNSIATPKMRLLLSSHVMQMLWLCALYTKWMHGTELALLSDYIFCCRRWWNEATWNPCRFFSRYTFYINTSTSYVYGFPDENLFFLFLLFLRFFLSHLLHVIIKCLDKVTHHVLSLSLSLALSLSLFLSLSLSLSCSSIPLACLLYSYITIDFSDDGRAICSHLAMSQT